MHKGRSLVKPMMTASSDEYMILVMGWYLADSRNNGTSMTKHIILNNRESVTDWLQPNDVFIMDRHFHDSFASLKQIKIYSVHASFLQKKTEKQLTTAEASQPRFITKIL